MPNFVCAQLDEFKFPAKIGECEFLWQKWELKQGKRTDNRVVFVSCDDDKFLLNIRAKDDGFVVKGDKITKPANISHLHSALNAIKAAYAKGVVADTLSTKNSEKLQYVLDPSRLVAVLNGDEDENAFLFPHIFGIWNLEYFDEIRLEIGFGNGKHLLYRAQNEPQVLFVGLEVYRPGIARASKISSDLGLKNVLFVQSDARQLCELFKDDLFDMIYMHFPVPWNDSPTRRVVNANFVLEVNRILKQNGKFELRSDDIEFFTDSVKLFAKLPSAEMKIIKDRQLEVVSKYESRWREQNKDIYDMIYICDKKVDLLHHCDTCDFEFGNISSEAIELIKKKFTNRTAKYIDFFVHYECLYESEDEQSLLLKVSFGDFFTPCSSYILITQSGAQYLIKPPATKANAAAHEKLMEYISCQIS